MGAGSRILRSSYSSIGVMPKQLRGKYPPMAVSPDRHELTGPDLKVFVLTNTFQFQMNQPPYSSLAIANWFISRGGNNLTPLKLQKLIYYAHGWHLALKGQALIDEAIQAWPYGPVVPTVYHEFKDYGDRPIPQNALAEEFEQDPKGAMIAVTPTVPGSDTETNRFLQKIAEVFDRYSGVELSAFTHQPGTPWHALKQLHQNLKGIIITNDEIKAYFINLASQSHPNA
ncbi:MAG: SocA family protein [Deltaproteobacteria bacterium]|nr:SocA family protein [Deltaproteobacteria bacterium]